MRRHFICTNHSMGYHDQSNHSGLSLRNGDIEDKQKNTHLFSCLLVPASRLSRSVYDIKNVAILCHEMFCRVIAPNAAGLLAVKNTAAVTACPAQVPYLHIVSSDTAEYGPTIGEQQMHRPTILSISIANLVMKTHDTTIYAYSGLDLSFQISSKSGD